MVNLFACDENPVQAAKCLPDKLIVKMPLETAQILCSAVWNRGESAPYKPTHIKHPCVLWVGRSAGNWEWTVRHGLALCVEFTSRYGKEHASEKIIREVSDRGPRTGELERFALAMPDEYKSHGDPVACYRAFMVAEKSHYARWKDPETRPSWWDATRDAARPMSKEQSTTPTEVNAMPARRAAPLRRTKSKSR